MLIGKKTIGTIAYLGGVMSLPEPFVWSWTQMIQYNHDYFVGENEQIFYNRSTVSYHSFARNSLVDQMQGEFMLMLDTDIVFSPDIAVRMYHKMETHNIDVLALMYPYKKYPHAPVMYGYEPKTKQAYILGDWSQDVSIMQIHSAGAGCLMFRKSVIDTIREKKQNPFDQIRDLSEDHSFFERLHKLGVKAYTSPQMEVEHLIYRNLSVSRDYPRKEMKVGRKIKVEGYDVIDKEE